MALYLGQNHYVILCKELVKGTGLYAVVGVSEAGCGPGATVAQQGPSGEEKVGMKWDK